MTRIVGILNVTPDSFSDGGRWQNPDDAIAHAVAMREQGAALVDVGGESTRPGATPVDPVEEQRRVIPIVRALAARGIPISIDTEERRDRARRGRSRRRGRQRRLGRAVRRGDGAGGRRDRRDVHRHALARRRGRRAAVHRRGLRGAQRAAIADRRAHRRRGGPASDRHRSGSRVREGFASTTGSCSRVSASSPRSATAS